MVAAAGSRRRNVEAILERFAAVVDKAAARRSQKRVETAGDH
jgi:hypothetical protein